MTNDNRELIPADPYSTDDLDRASEHIFRTTLPGSVKNALASKLREMRSRADDPGYFGPARWTLPAEILELPVAANPIAVADEDWISVYARVCSANLVEQLGQVGLERLVREVLAAVRERAAKAGA